MFRVATWNVNSIRVRLQHVLDWLAQAKPDVLALQETKIVDEAFPKEYFREAGYQITCNGQKTYNGVAIAHKTDPLDVITALPGLDDSQKRVLCLTLQGITILNLYVPNGSEVGSEKYIYKLNWLDQLHGFTATLGKKNNRIIILGDFNIAPEDRDVHDPAAWEGSVLVSEPEREHFRTLLASGFRDCFRLFEQTGEYYSWWDYRAAAFRRNNGLRIDHILASNPLAELCTACWIDRAPRELERPSDHTPVIAEFDL